jgi:ribosomal protein L32
MAVQKSRVTPSRRGQRRAHDALSAKQLSTDPTTGECICATTSPPTVSTAARR